MVRFYCAVWSACLCKMSILQYFKNQEKTTSLSEDSLPDPKGLLSEKISSKAIFTANQKVTEVLEKQGEKSVRGHYHTEWLFVRARTNRILAIRMAIDHVIVILPHPIITNQSIQFIASTEGEYPQHGGSRYNKKNK